MDVKYHKLLGVSVSNDKLACYDQATTTASRNHWKKPSVVDLVFFACDIVWFNTGIHESVGRRFWQVEKSHVRDTRMWALLCMCETLHMSQPDFWCTAGGENLQLGHGYLSQWYSYSEEDQGQKATGILVWQYFLYPLEKYRDSSRWLFVNESVMI